MSKKKAIVRFHDTVETLIALADKGTDADNRHGTSTGWAGGTFDDAVRLARTGWMEAVREAEKMFDKIDAEVNTGIERVILEDVCGAYPIVPEVLAGYPLCMRRPDMVRSDTTSVKVFVSITGSAMFTPEQLAQRGAAILAFTMKLKELRPVELYAHGDLGTTSGGGACFDVVRIGTEPMDLALASFLIGHPSALRRLMFCAADPHGFTGGWCWGCNPRESNHRKWKAEVLGATEADVMIDGALSGDPIAADPLAWVTREIARYKVEEEAAY